MMLSPRALAAFLVGLSFVTCQAQEAKGERWKSLFDGNSLAGWKVTEFFQPGAVKVENSFRDGGPAIVLETGTFLTGITVANEKDVPRNNYEVRLEAMKIEGNDFFCALTFPVRETACTLVVGGWGGRVVGLSNIDDSDASDNETSQGKEFTADRWYKIRVRVTDAKIEAWLDAEQIIDFETKDRKIGLRWGEIELSAPLGVAAYKTKAAVRGIEIRSLAGAAKK